MNGKHFLIATLIGVVLATVVFTPLSGQQDSTYDPWIDHNEDGTVGVNDLSPLGKAYGSSGDPTKNVTVTNFPLDEQGNLKVSTPRFTTYSKYAAFAVGAGNERTLFGISGLGRLRYVIAKLEGEWWWVSELSPLKIYTDGELTMEISPTDAERFRSTGQVSIPRLILELYDTAASDFQWGIELESYFGSNLVITFENKDTTNSVVIYAFMMYETYA